MSTRTLAALETLLDRNALHALLAPALGGATALMAVEVRYVRAKPGASVTLGLALDWQASGGPVGTLGSLYIAPRGVVEALRKAVALHPSAPAAGPSLALLAEPGALFLAFPNDRSLRGLPAASDPRRLANRLVHPGFPFSALGWRVRKRDARVTPVRFKPGRRAVLRADLTLARLEGSGRSPLPAYVRVVPAAGLPALEARWRAAAGATGAHPPAVLGSDPERGLLLVAAVAGDAFDGPPSDRACAALAEALTAVHRAVPADTTGLAGHDDARVLAAASAALDTLAALSGTHAPAAHRLRDALARAAAGLTPVAPAFVHGDLTLDQVLLGPAGAMLLDWDEAGIGDPHLDWASLDADAAACGRAHAGVAALEPLAADALGARFSAARFRWQRGAAHARRVLAGLQAGRPGWQDEAGRALDRANAALAVRPPRALAGRAPAAATGADAWLARVLDRASRAALGVDPAWRLAALWPERDGFQARFERGDGAIAGWLRAGDRTTWIPFPGDPALPALARRIAAGEHLALAHRLGRRAALRARDGSHVLFLRPPGTARSTFERLVSTHLVLGRAGVVQAAPHSFEEADGAWRSTLMAGNVLDPARADAPTWSALGAAVARVHAAEAPVGAPVRDWDGALSSARRQIALVVRGDASLGERLAVALEQVTADHPAGGPPARAMVHGDLHPAQVLVDGHITLLDWERAGAGDPEEDLGNLAAHLWWARGGGARTAWGAFLDGYTRAGGIRRHERFEAHARAALLRVLAVHAWRDDERARVLGGSAHWDAWTEEVSRW